MLSKYTSRKKVSHAELTATPEVIPQDKQEKTLTIESKPVKTSKRGRKAGVRLKHRPRATRSFHYGGVNFFIINLGDRASVCTVEEGQAEPMPRVTVSANNVKSAVQLLSGIIRSEKKLDALNIQQ